jgi:hypothetical protein
MRYFVFALIFIFTHSVYAADLRPAGTAEAEDRAQQASTARHERDAKRAAKEEAERRAAFEAAERRASQEAARAAREAAERKAAEEAARLAQQEAERKAAEEAARLAQQEAERKAAEEAARLARQEAERKAAEEAARLAQQEAERKAAEEAARLAQQEAERKAQAALASAAKSTIAVSPEIESCAIPFTIQNEQAARSIRERARADAEAHANDASALMRTAQDSITSLASAYALDQGAVNKVYFSALCQKLYEMALSPFSLKAFLTKLAALLNISYPASGDDAVAFAPAAVQPQASSPIAQDAVEPKTVPAPKPEEPSIGPGSSEAGHQIPRRAESSQAKKTAEPTEAAKQDQDIAVSGESDRDRAVAASTEAAPSPVSQSAPENRGAIDAVGTATQRPESSAAPEQDAAKLSGALDEEACRALGVLGNCPNLNAILGRLLEKPLQYNHPKRMLLGKTSEIGLVLRTDWEGKDLPKDISEELKGLPGDIKQGLSKITQIISAELTGQNFEISPSGRQEQTIAPPKPASWSWRVKPVKTGKGQTLKLRLYAHIPPGTMPPILVKTLDATIDVDVTTWDWLLAQAQTLEPIYAIFAALLGLFTAIITFILVRRRRAAERARIYPETGGYFDVPNPYETALRKRNGPIIGDLSQSMVDNRTPILPKQSGAKPIEKPDGDTEPEKD